MVITATIRDNIDWQLPDFPIDRDGEDGKPLTTKDGSELSKSQQKGIKKESNNQEKAIQKVLKAAGDQGIEKYIEQLEQQLADLKVSM